MVSKTENVPVKRVETDEQPAQSLTSLRGEIDRVFDDFMTGWPSFGRWPRFAPVRQFGERSWALSPDVDISETDDKYEITAELPGLSEQEIELTLSGDTLMLKGEKKEEHEEKKKDYYLSERRYGAFQRSFTLPDDVDPEKIDTRFSQGVLTITLPKSEEAKAKVRQIEVKAD